MKFTATRLRYRIKLIIRYIMKLGKPEKIIFYPDLPGKKTVLFKIITHNGYFMTNRIINNPDLLISWEDKTFRKSPYVLQKKYPSLRIINLHCTDISKDLIQKKFEEVFGYKFEIDPTAYKGVCLEKNDINATHDCNIIECPIAETRPGYVYQKLINNKAANGLFLDIRTPIFGNTIPHLYLKFSKQESRFASGSDLHACVDVSEQFTDSEVGKILAFCRAISLDYGELDIVRDATDNLLYIVDANSTPIGPSTSMMTEKENAEVIQRLSNAFDREFLKHP